MKFFISSSMLIFLLSLVPFLFRTSHSATIVADGVSQWKNPTVHIGDAIIFNTSHQFKLYIFRNENAFNLCNLTEATLLSKPNSTSFTWHPSRLGFFYFSFVNGSVLTCKASQKLAIRVYPTAAPPENATPEMPPTAAPAPDSGEGFIPSTPAFPWPNRPRQATAPAQSPAGSSSATDKGGGVPFINSNPAVPLPTGEVDSATLRPLPTSGHNEQVMVGLHGVHVQMVLVTLVSLVSLL